MGGGVGESERRVAESEIWCHIWTDVISACGWREGRRQMDRVRLEIPKSLALARSAADAPLADYDPLSITRSQSYLHALYSYMTLTDL